MYLIHELLKDIEVLNINTFLEPSKGFPAEDGRKIVVRQRLVSDSPKAFGKLV
ncbi:hypothetical protein D3C86_2096260 [compost metagenome]